MSFPRYPRYKDSGVEWLGRVPEHWRVVPLSKVTISRCDGPFGSGLKSEHYSTSGVRVIRLQNIRSDGFDETDAAFIDAGYYARELGGHDVMGGDVLIAGLGDDNNTVGRACVAPVGIEPAMVKADCFRYRLDSARVQPEFVAAALNASAAADAGRLSSGSTRSRIPLSTMATRRIGIPPLHEQGIITDFLRREVGKIDELVAEQERLADLLKEKRQAAISHAVTRGLNPKAPMKPSGFEWLGVVPTHWTLVPLGRVTVSRCDGPFGSGLKSAHYTDSGVRVIRLQNIRRDAFDGTDEAFIDPHYYESELGGHDVKSGDVLIAGLGDDNNTVGRACVAPLGVEPAMVKADCFRFRLDTTRVLPEFVATFLTAGAAADAGLLSSGSTRSRISLSTMAGRKLAIPPMSEQNEIADFIRAETLKLDTLTAEAQRSIDLLQERRTALISAAVTGQIDVRGLVEAEAA